MCSGRTTGHVGIRMRTPRDADSPRRLPQHGSRLGLGVPVSKDFLHKHPNFINLVVGQVTVYVINTVAYAIYDAGTRSAAQDEPPLYEVVGSAVWRPQLLGRCSGLLVTPRGTGRRSGGARTDAPSRRTCVLTGPTGGHAVLTALFSRRSSVPAASDGESRRFHLPPAALRALQPRDRGGVLLRSRLQPHQ